MNLSLVGAVYDWILLLLDDWIYKGQLSKFMGFIYQVHPCSSHPWHTCGAPLKLTNHIYIHKSQQMLFGGKKVPKNCEKVAKNCESVVVGNPQ
jgi:hypothetical protein